MPNKTNTTTAGARTQNNMISWAEKVPAISINPQMASSHDVARLASELMEARHVACQVLSAMQHHFSPMDRHWCEEKLKLLTSVQPE